MNRPAAFAAALSGLPGMGPAGLVRILEEYEPESAWSAVVAGTVVRPPKARAGPSGQLRLDGPPPPRPASWAIIAGRLDPLEWWEPIGATGIGVTWRGRPDYPTALVGDPQPPGVLFWRGDLAVLDRPSVAIVGTRNATPDGRAVAFELGRDLAAAGVSVVSGLALGIDGAAHRGCIDAVRREAPGAPVGVAASGVDVPYPRQHRELWREVSAAGVILSENLPGRPAQAWRFPSRNRVIAGLVQMVVVVESHTCGGSLITAEAAIDRGVEVRVVPGPVRSPASAGSNQLLYDGPGPVRCARDVLDALGMVRPDPPPPGDVRITSPSRPGSATNGPPGPATGRLPSMVLDALGRRPATIGMLMARSGLAAADVVRALEILRSEGLAVERDGWWSCG